MRRGGSLTKDILKPRAEVCVALHEPTIEMTVVHDMSLLYERGDCA